MESRGSTDRQADEKAERLARRFGIKKVSTVLALLE
jgi:hypothetical protein